MEHGRLCDGQDSRTTSWNRHQAARQIFGNLGKFDFAGRRVELGRGWSVTRCATCLANAIEEVVCAQIRRDGRMRQDFRLRTVESTRDIIESNPTKIGATQVAQMPGLRQTLRNMEVAQVDQIGGVGEQPLKCYKTGRLIMLFRLSIIFHTQVQKTPRPE